MPPKYAESTWDKVPADSLIRRYAATVLDRVAAGHGLYVYGDYGSGKSSAAALVLAEALKHDVTARWWSVTDLMVALEDRWTRQEVMRGVGFVRLLVLDDFGTAMMTAEYEQWMDQIVERRYQRRLSVVVTSNLTPVEVAKHKQFGRIADRWRETSKSVDMKRPSMRARIDGGW